MDTRQPQRRPAQRNGRSGNNCGQEAFPPVSVKEQNPRYAKMLKLDMASSRSTFTCSAQYLYQSCILAQTNPQLSKLLHNFAIDELHHTKVLGELIVALGGNPSYSVVQYNRMMVWNGTMVSYTQTPAQMMSENVAVQKFLIQRYEEQMEAIREECAVEILKCILKTEHMHLSVFEKNSEP